LISVTVSFVAQANRAGAMALFLAAFPAPAERLPIQRHGVSEGLADPAAHRL